VTKRWNPAPALCEAVRRHHDPMASEIDPNLCAIVSLANSLSIKLGIGPERNPELDLTELESTLMLTLEPQRLAEISQIVKQKLTEEKSAYAVA